jgi:hypothetical protein
MLTVLEFYKCWLHINLVTRDCIERSAWKHLTFVVLRHERYGSNLTHSEDLNTVGIKVTQAQSFQGDNLISLIG